MVQRYMVKGNLFLRDHVEPNIASRHCLELTVGIGSLTHILCPRTSLVIPTSIMCWKSNSPGGTLNFNLIKVILNSKCLAMK